MKESVYKDYDELPLFLNAATVAKVLDVSPSSGYELMHEPDFPVLKVGSRLVVVYPVSNKTLRRWGNKVYFSKTDWRMEKCHAIL